MERPTVSVIVPVYRVEPYLCKCLDSLMNQTYRNLEIIMVDDGSPDNCGDICDAYAAKDGRFRVIHSENRGAFAARNLALKEASGKYIGFVDADDWLEPCMYEVLLELAQEYDADVAQCEMRNEGEYEQLRSQKLGGISLFRQGQLLRELFRERITHGLTNKLFRREIWQNRQFPEDYYHMDAVFMTEVCQFCRTFVRTDEGLYHYNTTSPSITRGQKKPRHIHSAEKLFEAYSAAAQNAEEDGSYFICREIPSGGRLIPPGGEITVRMAVKHITRMHKIFMRHWAAAQKTKGYQESPKAKRLLWNVYAVAPLTATVLVCGYGQIKKREVR